MAIIEREHVLARHRGDAGADILGGRDVFDGFGAGEGGEALLRLGHGLGLDRDDRAPDAGARHHRLDHAGEHRPAGNVDEAFVGDAAGLRERIEVAAARGEHEGGVAGVAHSGGW